MRDHSAEIIHEGGVFLFTGVAGPKTCNHMCVMGPELLLAPTARFWLVFSIGGFIAVADLARRPE